jgi:hypothetical protein
MSTERDYLNIQLSKLS